MAKHPVPKKKVSNAKTASRYASFAFKKRRKLEGFLGIVLCKTCGNPRLNQQACKACGMYRGRSVMGARASKGKEKVTKIKV